MTSPRLALGFGAVAAVGLANVLAVVATPLQVIAMSLIGGGVAVTLAVRAVLTDPRDTTGAVYASLPGTLATLAGDWGPWLLGLIGALLLAAAELGTWSGEHRGPAPDPALTGQRVARSLGLAGTGLAAGLVLTLISLVPVPEGTLGVLLAALAVAGIAGLLLARRT